MGWGEVKSREAKRAAEAVSTKRWVKGETEAPTVQPHDVSVRRL